MSARAWAIWIAVLTVVLLAVALLAMSGVRPPHRAPEPITTDIQLETL